MKTGIYLGLVLTAALAVLGAACQPASNVSTNSSMNQNSMTMNGNMAMNQNGMMNGNSMMNQNSMTMNGNSNMSGMMDMNSSPNAASQPYDLQFIDTMTHHHQGALDMAKMAIEKTQNAELKAFAQKISRPEQGNRADERLAREMVCGKTAGDEYGNALNGGFDENGYEQTHEFKRQRV